MNMNNSLWISVKDRLPEKEKKYLVACRADPTKEYYYEYYFFCKNLPDYYPYEFSREEYEGKSGFVYFDHYFEEGRLADDVRFWMDVPEAPSQTNGD